MHSTRNSPYKWHNHPVGSALNYGLLAAFSLLLVHGCRNPSGKAADNIPLNVILITSDDLGKQLSCYGDSIIETPNLDKLAASGMMFHNAFVTQASCSSSRSSILTGTWPHVNGQIGLAHLGFQMNGNYPNIAASLKEQGYFNGVIGKIHVRPEEQFPFDYKRTVSRETRSMALVTARVDSFLSMASGKPFFLYMNYMDPHFPFVRQYEGRPGNPLSPEDVCPLPFQGVDDPEEMQRIADFYCCIGRLDEGIGILMDQLEQRGLLENSVVLFIGDHGAPFNRGKGAGYEASLGIPFFVSCPGITIPGQESHALVSTADIYPTLLEILGIAIPQTVQGESLLPVLNGESESVRDHLFAEYTYHTHELSTFFPRRTIRDQRYKLIYNVGAELISNEMTSIDQDPAYRLSRQVRYEGTWVRKVFDRFHQPPVIELYDLLKDPYEKINLAGDPEFAKIREDLLRSLKAWMAATVDPYRDLESVRQEILDPAVPQDSR